MTDRCWFATRDPRPCDEPLIRAHLIPRQLIRKTVRLQTLREAAARMTVKEALKLADEAEGIACRDPRGWVPCCGGPMGNGGHHGMLDQSRTLRITFGDLPAELHEFAEGLGLGWYLQREYGERT